MKLEFRGYLKLGTSEGCSICTVSVSIYILGLLYNDYSHNLFIILTTILLRFNNNIQL